MKAAENYLTQTLRHLAYLGVPCKLEYWPEMDQWTADIGPSLAGYHCRANTPTAALRFIYGVWKSEREM